MTCCVQNKKKLDGCVVIDSPPTFLPSEFPDHTSAMSREFKDFSLMEEEDSATQPLPAENSGYNSKSKCVLPAEERIVFQRNTVLDRHTVSVNLPVTIA